MQVFVSHAKPDSQLATALATHLSAQGLNVAYPGKDFYPGDNWALKTGKALERSDALVILLSPESKHSESITHEIEFALGSDRFRNRIIPVLVRQTRNIPWILRKFPMVLFRGDSAELAKKVCEVLMP